MPLEKTFEAGGKTYLIKSHAWQRVRKTDIDLADIVRIIEAGEIMVKLKHKTEYVGCYTPRWAQRKGVEKSIAVKIVIDTRSTLTLKTIHRMGDCPREE
jgi:hypothetical protein